MKLRIRVSSPDREPIDQIVDVPDHTTVVEVDVALWRDNDKFGGVVGRVSHSFVTTTQAPLK